MGVSTFDGCKSLTEVILANKVQSIGSYAFYACPLTTLVSQNTVPPTVENKNFVDSDIYKNATLYVPEEALEAYKAAEIWKDFYNYDIDGITSAVVDSNKIRISGNTIQIDGNPTDVKIYDISGRVIYDGTANEITIRDRGIFMVIIDNITHKIAF